MFLAIPIDSPFNGTTGIFKEISNSFLFIFVTFPTVVEVFTLNINNSFGFILSTFSCFSVPKSFSNSSNFIFTFEVISGSSSFVEAMHPDKESVFARLGSSSVSIARLPPGRASSIVYSPLWRETIFVVIVLYSVSLCFL